MADKEDDDMVVVEEKEPEEAVSGEIDSTKEDDAEKKEVKQLTKKPRRGADGNTKRGNDSQKKINELWLRAKEKEQEANQERQKNKEYEKITASALEENINTKRDLLTERLIRAQETGDNKKSAEITAELSKIEAQAAQIDRYKLENQVSPQQQQQRQQIEAQKVAPEDVYENLSPSGKRWMDENKDWYNEDSDNYDEDKVSDVTYYAQKLERQYLSTGQEAEIGTRSYFKKIDDYIKQNWNEDMDSSQENTEQQSAPKKNYAAPVGNRSNGSSPQGQRKEYKITQQEKEFALALNSKDKSGKRLSDDEKIKRFVSLREGTPSSGPISMNSIKKGA